MDVSLARFSARLVFDIVYGRVSSTRFFLAIRFRHCLFGRVSFYDSHLAGCPLDLRYRSCFDIGLVWCSGSDIDIQHSIVRSIWLSDSAIHYGALSCLELDSVSFIG